MIEQTHDDLSNVIPMCPDFHDEDGEEMEDILFFCVNVNGRVEFHVWYDGDWEPTPLSPEGMYDVYPPELFNWVYYDEATNEIRKDS